ncbi:hypothetical protein ACFX15_007589 [Malus domestica]
MESHLDLSQSSTEPQGVKRNPHQTRKPLARFQDYVTYSSRHPITESISLRGLSTTHAAFLYEIDKHCEPRNFQEASLLPQWNQAMTKELRALEENHTGAWSNYLQGKMLLEAVGFTRPSSKLMVQSRDTRLGLLLEVSLKPLE